MKDFFENVGTIKNLSNSLTNPSQILLPKSIQIEGCINEVALISDVKQQIKYTDLDTTFIDAPNLSNKLTIDKSIQFLPKSTSVIEIDIGIDEVGRGPLYGSVVVAGVILAKQYSDEIEFNPLQGTELKTLTDSKKLTEIKRQKLYPLIKQNALAYALVDVPAEVIDEVNILQASLIGMRLTAERLITQIVNLVMTNYNAIKQSTSIAKDLCIKINILIDGNKIPELDQAYLSKNGIITVVKTNDLKQATPYCQLNFKKKSENVLSKTSFEDNSNSKIHRKSENTSDNLLANDTSKPCDKGLTGFISMQAFIKGDAHHTAIAAASVLAKVTRDAQLIAEDVIYPKYGFAAHKGYPTKAHLSALNTYGALPKHRRSFKPVALAIKQQRHFTTI